MHDDEFAPKDLHLEAGEAVSVEVRNDRNQGHNFTIDELDLSTGTLEPGDVMTATFVVPNGTTGVPLHLRPGHARRDPRPLIARHFQLIVDIPAAELPSSAPSRIAERRDSSRRQSRPDVPSRRLDSGSQSSGASRSKPPVTFPSLSSTGGSRAAE
jgi:hypothetical protein